MDVTQLNKWLILWHW